MFVENRHAAAYSTANKKHTCRECEGLDHVRFEDKLFHGHAIVGRDYAREHVIIANYRRKTITNVIERRGPVPPAGLSRSDRLV
jgi:hypothetical protein